LRHRKVLRQNFRYEKFTALPCPEFIEGGGKF